MDTDNLKWLMRDVSEKAFQAQVIQAARLTGWMVYHVFDARRSEPGYPDLTLVHPTRYPGNLIVAELKTEVGHVTKAQQRWLDALRANGVEAPVWRPSDIDEVIERLKR